MDWSDIEAGSHSKIKFTFRENHKKTWTIHIGQDVQVRGVRMN